ncbi:alpha/beta fold hydrolase [Actinomycetaceae bacterium MB13-C1-2]|nr:alpha/beta fold hydrolase [Actinomycetaceae bacterium MB13-C1-2]
MSEVRILTPRGVELAGTYTAPVDSTDAAVLFSHSFLMDRSSSAHFPKLAKRYRGLGYATLGFDYSGHGSSDDDRITVEHRTEDLRAASGWLAEQGYTRQLIHAHSTGSLSAFRGRPPAVESLFVTSGVLGPVSYEWESIFSSEQLDELDRTGLMEIPDDSPTPRRCFTINSQTLIDLSLNKPEELLHDLTSPVCLVFDRADEKRGLVATATEAFHLLPDGSRLEVVEDAAFSLEENLDLLCDLAEKWIVQQLPIGRTHSGQSGRV